MLNEIHLARADLNLLTLFEVILRERHVGRAAIRLNLTSSAVSHGLGRLRRMLNDPLFLRTPKGVVPTARALALAGPVADLLAQARNVLASAAPFDPATSTRRFVIGAPDGSVFLGPLLAILRERAPGIDIGLRQLLPPQGGQSVAQAWTLVFAELETGSMDIAVAPIDRAPPRFVVRTIYDEDFVVVARTRHPFAARPTLQRFCQMQHVVVSKTADPHGFVDEALGEAWARPPRRVDRAGFRLGAFDGGGNRLDFDDAAAFRGDACRALRGGEQGGSAALAGIHHQGRCAQGGADGFGLAWLFEMLGEAVEGRGAKVRRRPEARAAS